MIEPVNERNAFLRKSKQTKTVDQNTEASLRQILKVRDEAGNDKNRYNMNSNSESLYKQRKIRIATTRENQEEGFCAQDTKMSYREQKLIHTAQ